jgi:cytochrome c556
MKKIILASIIIALSGAVHAESAFTNADDALKYRKASFSLIRHNTADIADMVVKGAVPFDAKRVQKRADALAALTTLPWDAFAVPGAEQKPGDTKAEAWKNNADFTKRAQSFVADAKALQVAANGGDQAAIKAAFIAFSKNCKACHEQYKAD